REEAVVRRGPAEDRLAGRGGGRADAPARVRRLPPEDLESGALGVVVRGPGDLRVGSDGARDRHVARSRGGLREPPERLGVDAGDVADETEIQEREEVAVLAPVLAPRRLVLVIVVFERLGETDGRKARLDEGPVIAAASQPIEPEDQPDG